MRETEDGILHEVVSGSADLGLRARKLLEFMGERRSVRGFSDRQIPRDVLESCIAIAASAPSGANAQQWSFVLVESPDVKRRIRASAEDVERDFYKNRIPDQWRDQLKPLSTDFRKPFLEEAPYLVCVFQQRYGVRGDGSSRAHYYTPQSVGIATGFLIASLHLLGISSLTYTPAPMDFLCEILQRPENEKPYMIVAAGYRHPGHTPPVITRKSAGEWLTVV